MTMEIWKEGIPPVAIREISVLRELKHPNVVELFDSFVSRSGNLYVLEDSFSNSVYSLNFCHCCRYLVFELMNADLSGMIKTMKTLPNPMMSPDWVKYLTWQMLLGVEQCHRHRIIHRDLKPQNILIDTTNGLVKLADFGLARSFSLPLRPYTHEVVTLWYRSPEVLLGQNVYSPAIDIWSLGCIFAELAVGAPIFQGDSEIGQLFKIFNSLGTPDPTVWEGLDRLPGFNTMFPKFPMRSIRYLVPNMDPAGMDLLAHMLRFNPTHRITAAEALTHPYFQDVQKPSTPLVPSGCPPQPSSNGEE